MSSAACRKMPEVRHSLTGFEILRCVIENFRLRVGLFIQYNRNIEERNDAAALFLRLEFLEESII